MTPPMYLAPCIGRSAGTFKRVLHKSGGPAGVLLGAIASLAACHRPTPAAKPRPPDVGVVTVISENVPVYGDWVATLDGYINANIQPQVSGYLIRQDYREGSLVHQGDVLFEIDPRPFQAALDQATGQLAQARGQLAQAQAQLGLAEINVRRDTPLAAAHAVAQSQLDNEIQSRRQTTGLVQTDQAAIQASQAAVEAARLNLGFTKVRALVDGIAGIATTQIGNLVSPTTLLTTVSQVDPIKVYFSISEQEYLLLAGRIHSGAPADLLRRNTALPLQLTLANGNVYPHRGRILFADRQVDPSTGTIRIVGAFDNPGNLLRPGQFGRIRATTVVHNGALLVPQRAVSELQGRYQVAVVGSDNRVSIHNVEPGDRIGQNWIITSGLQAGQRVVSQGTSKITAGQTVHPIPDTQSGSQ
ncbi:MAG TPA: efflux RND transporter periplasmic adaptor subunit [Bryobacteraceae bacterium]|nr:efflux RND transporter periplasmic adaptor subunit [Bryobacteraceae bacterium]